MSIIHAAIVRAGLVTVTCPHCRRPQQKPRRPVREFRVCRFCHKQFPFDAGSGASAAKPRRR